VAKPLPTVLKPPEVSGEQDVREELQRKLNAAPVEHAAAVLSLYELLQALHSSGALDLLRGFFGASTDIASRLSVALSSPEAIRSIRNMLVLAQIAGRMDQALLESLRDAITETSEISRQNGDRPPRLWTILKRADSEDSLRALSAAADFLERFGKRLKSPPGSNGEH
jgi:uncharacterized protein YjgD (DUF1641 family)